jgi:hypothetical protein
MMVAHQRAQLVGLAVDHQHVARLRQGQRGMDHEVVAGTHFHGEGRAGQLHVRAQRPHAAMQGAAAALDV